MTINDILAEVTASMCAGCLGQIDLKKDDYYTVYKSGDAINFCHKCGEAAIHCMKTYKEFAEPVKKESKE